MPLISLDLETTGTDIDEGAVPIEIGLAVTDPSGITTLSVAFPINPRRCDQGYAWSDQAAEVHGVGRGEAEQRGEDPHIVAARSIVWLADMGIGGPKMDRWPMGWNVGSFDMPFVRRYLPALGDWLSYRTLDLNAVVFLGAQLLGEDFGKLKSRLKERAIGDVEPAWHTAGFDAWAGHQAYVRLVAMLEQLRS